MESKNKPLFRKGEPFTDMAHKKPTVEMAHPKDMAHQVDFPDLMPLKAQEIASSKNRRERVSGMVSFFIDLRTYADSYEISIAEINKFRVKKLKDNGGFNIGQVGIRSGEAKLVRDKTPELPRKEGSEKDVYRKKENRNELLVLLDRKLVEEASELIVDARTKEERIEELADLYEVLDAILKYRNIDMKEITPSLQTHEVIQRRNYRRGKV